MPKTKPTSGKNSPLAAREPLTVRRDKGKIWSHVRAKWLEETPEESVRQEYLCVLVNEYGFALEQIDEELEVVGRGSGHARADVVIWRTAKEKSDSKNPLIVVECKSNNVTIKPDDYGQGDNYSRLTGARFFVTHNNRETKFWRVLHDRMPKSMEEIDGIPHARASDAEIEDLIKKLKVFKEDQFAELLHKCHNIIRNREHLDPAAAFDEIAKILFMKVCFERRLAKGKYRRNLFTAEFLDEQSVINKDAVAVLFNETKDEYEADYLFADDDEINLRFATVKEIVGLLERYNLSDTSEDVKGIAFERFLGRTFRGEIGQFFTPREIVKFMVEMVEPDFGDVICDPASGSGGFLIRYFAKVREQMLERADAEYAAFKADVEQRKGWSKAKIAKALREKFEWHQRDLDPKNLQSSMWRLANQCIYGTDANDRMARTSKMNMIMHGDGHGGVHQWNGFVNVNGIFEGRFDIILTNPPFGSHVDPSAVVEVPDGKQWDEAKRRYAREYGAMYKDAIARVEAAKGKAIASLFELPKRANDSNGKEKFGKIKTEILFIERCLSLLKPGGRLGIVLPEGIFNNPSLAYVREFCENRAFIRAVVSLPQETFLSSGASVKASLLFLQKFTPKEAAAFEMINVVACSEIEAKHKDEIAKETKRLNGAIAAAKKVNDAAKRKMLKRELADYTKRMDELIATETRALLKERFPYPIFLYEAEKVGITATGDADQNELFPNDNPLPGGAKTCLELYREFRANPTAFMLSETA